MKSFLNVILLSLLAVAVFTTCDSPMGMGDAIDWEPPVLTLDPKPPTPMYVRFGAQLTGTVTDNIGVDRVIMRDSVSGEEYFRATLLGNDRWRIELDFSAEQNGQTVLVDVVAFDRAGNSGAESIESIVLIIDIRPPIVNDIWIQRSSTRTADLVQYSDFVDLEAMDLRAEISANVNKYQNGAFNIKAKLSEEETRIETIYLKIFDKDHPNNELLSLLPESGSSLYNPQWYVTEDMLLNAGASILQIPNYISNYKDNNERYYYRVRIVATDKSANESGVIEEGGLLIIEDQGYFCLWNQADYPKGILDPVVVGAGTDIVITKGSSLPIEFFDDDKIEWAYAALFTKEQWDGTANIAPSVTLSGTDNDKFETLKNKLLNGDVVYNWRYDRYSEASDANKIVNLISAPADEKLHYIITGKSPADYGDFVLVTFVKDQKQSPHKASEYGDIIKYRKYNLSLVDENAPLIVFDKAGGSPEENTFPSLDPSGKFKIHGYTLREDKDQAGVNQVEIFRLAWIPFMINNDHGGPEENIPVVKKALEENTGFPEDVQWWDLSASVKTSVSYERIPDTSEGTYFRKQLFSKTFSILGDPDVDKSTYDNFRITKGGDLENATKLFVFYAEDNMGHKVFTQFYLLGNKTPPSIDIWDITDKLQMTYSSSDTSHTNSPPSVLEDAPLTGAITQNYITKRTNFNTAKYQDLKTAAKSVSTTDLTSAYRVYPRGTIVKFWAEAKANGALSIKTISMKDITYEDPSTHVELGYFGGSVDSTYSYVEYFPEVSQRVFEFTITDMLNNVAKVQRTIAIASASTLTSITTAKQNGTYPAGEEIILKANFDGLIKLQSNTTATKPKLNVLYNISGSPKVEQITCENVDNTNGQLYLEFKFKVPANANGQLLTIYKGLANPSGLDKPIELTTGNNILDARENGGTAYTPGNVTGFFWDTVKNSLQYDSTNNPNGKTINLDGVAPKISSIGIVNTKTELTTGKWYLKNTESISFELTASKDLKVTGDTSLRFRLQKPDNTYTTYDTTNFSYRKVTGNKVVFTLDVSRTTIPNDGILQNDITIFNAAVITDNVGNPIDTSTFTTELNAFTQGKTIYFDLTAPPKPVTSLTGTQTTVNVGATPLQTLQYGTSPYMAITNVSADAEPYGTQKRQYSLDGGLNWLTFPTPINTTAQPWTTERDYNTLYILNGQWNLKTRFIDNAGNEGATTDQLIHVNNKFPTLLGVKVVQPNATYKSGTLSFTLDFDDTVTVPATGVTLRLENKNASNSNTPGSSDTPTYQKDITATAVENSRTVTFTWTLAANSKDMLDGLKIASLNINLLKDKFGNNGPATTTVTDTTVNIVPPVSPAPADPANNVTYDFSGIKVSTITPTISSRAPESAYNKTGNITTSVSSDNKTITLTFTKPMQKGNGNITIKPRAGYAIPAVFENEGYYIKYTYDSSGTITGETRSTTAGTDFTYVSGFYDIFNSIANTTQGNTDKNTLIGSTSMSAPAISNVTGLTTGPYLKTTNGLTQGAGYTGYYGNPSSQTAASITMPGNNAPGPRGTNFMVPDTETKWVLIYSVTNLFETTNNSTVNNIRGVLDRIKWRWQEIAVTNPSVVVSGKTVTITLAEPLLPGLKWDVTYSGATFTDEAGNQAAAESTYWFWSKGVQKPVIRVDRKSYDGRISADYNKSSYNNNIYYTASGYNGPITDFNTIYYKITSETPEARILLATLQGKNMAGNGLGSVTGAWSGQAANTTNSTLGISTDTAITWNGPKSSATQTTGTWVNTNLIYRHSRDGTYVTMTEPNISQAVKGADSNTNNVEGTADGRRYLGFRSYNRDATVSDLTLTPLITNSSLTSYTGNFTYTSQEASKNYIVAQAAIDHTALQSDETQSYTNPTSKSYNSFEGVFRTVIMIHQAGVTGSNGSTTNIVENSHPMMIAGTNFRNSLPTIAGFPLKDGTHRTDSRYVKFFYRGTGSETITATNLTTNPTNSFYWVTTEMVSSWYIQIIGLGNGHGTSSTMGDVEDWISAGYGDLSYAFNVYTNNANN